VYGKGTSLYPEDEKVRGVITSRILFEMGTFYKAFGDIVVSLIINNWNLEMSLSSILTFAVPNSV